MTDVRIERTDLQPTAVVKASTTRAAFPTLWRPMLDEVWALLATQPGLRTDGHNVMLYRHGLPGIELAVEVGVQVTRAFEPVGSVVASTVPATTAATALHTGPPSTIGATYDVIHDWCRESGRSTTGLSWEVYGDPDPETGAMTIAVYEELAD